MDKQPAGIGFCASYAVFNSLLPGAFISAEFKIINDMLNPSADMPDHSRYRLINYFLEKASDSKQGHEDSSPARINELFQDQKSHFYKIYQSARKYNKSISETWVPIEYKKNASVIGSSDPVFKLSMITNLVSLFFRYEANNPLMTSFLVHIKEHWLTFIWIAKKNVINLCLAMDSQNGGYHLPSIFAPIYKLLTHSEQLKKAAEKILTESCQELLKPAHTVVSAENLIQIHALLRCCKKLLKHDEFQGLVKLKYFHMIELKLNAYRDQTDHKWQNCCRLLTNAKKNKAKQEGLNIFSISR